MTNDPNPNDTGIDYEVQFENGDLTVPDWLDALANPPIPVKTRVVRVPTGPAALRDPANTSAFDEAHPGGKHKVKDEDGEVIEADEVVDAPGEPSAIASDARTPAPAPTGEDHAGPSMCMMNAIEPSDYVVPTWAKFIYDHWPSMPDTPAVLCEGPRGTGKTLMAIVVAARLGRPLLLVNCQPDMTAEMLLGTPRIKGGADYWQPGPIMLAAKHNAVLVLDEFNVLTPPAQLGIKPICDTVIKGLFIAYTGERVTWADPRIICNVNPDYSGTRTLQEACRDTMETVVAGYLPLEQEVNLIAGRTGCDHSIVHRAVTTANAIRAAAKGDPSSATLPLAFDLSPRALFSFARRVVSGQSEDVAWKEAVLDRVGSSFVTHATRENVRQLSISTGNYDMDAAEAN